MATTLDCVPPNTIVKIVDICAGPGLKTRLMSMGFTPNAKIKVLENSFGHVLVALDSGFGRTIALSRGIAKKILVELEP